MIALLSAADRAVAFICKWGVIGCLLGLFFLLLLAVIVRLLPIFALSGYDEIIELLFAWMTFLGSLALWREGSLYRVILIENAVSEPLRRAIGVMSQGLMLAFALVMAVYGYEFLINAGETTPFLGINKGFWYVAVPLTGAIMAIYSVIGLWRAALGQPPAGEGGTIIG
jgi:TRAP-type C4-dicarboxylate transport system permease small subunit